MELVQVGMKAQKKLNDEYSYKISYQQNHIQSMVQDILMDKGNKMNSVQEAISRLTKDINKLKETDKEETKSSESSQCLKSSELKFLKF